MISYILQRLGETSTWSGLVKLLTVAGVALNPDQATAIIALGLAVAGLIRVFLPDNLGGSKDAPVMVSRRVVPVFLLACLGLRAVECPVQAQLPWRRQVEQRLMGLERQGQQQPAPQAPPQIIVNPPTPMPAPVTPPLAYQGGPIPIFQMPSAPLIVPAPQPQVLPIAPQGPIQQLPIAGQPQQILNPQGSPQMQLPIQPQGPIQSLPQTAPLQQQLPLQLPQGSTPAPAQPQAAPTPVLPMPTPVPAPAAPSPQNQQLPAQPANPQQPQRLSGAVYSLWR